MKLSKRKAICNIFRFWNIKLSLEYVDLYTNTKLGSVAQRDQGREQPPIQSRLGPFWGPSLGFARFLRKWDLSAISVWKRKDFSSKLRKNICCGSSCRRSSHSISLCLDVDPWELPLFKNWQFGRSWYTEIYTEKKLPAVRFFTHSAAMTTVTIYAVITMVNWSMYLQNWIDIKEKQCHHHRD